MALINGDDYVSGDVESYQQNNRLKNHWRDNVADLTNPSPGMLMSDPADEKLYHRWAASWGEIVQGDVPLTDELAVIVGTDLDGKFYYDETTNDEVMIEARAHADCEGVTINLLETNQRFRIRQNSDIISWYHDGADANLAWTGTDLNLLSPAAAGVVVIQGGNFSIIKATDIFVTMDCSSITTANTNFDIKANRPNYGNTVGSYRFYNNGVNPVAQMTAQRGSSDIKGELIYFTSGFERLRIDEDGNISLSRAATSDNPYVRLSGYITAGAAARHANFRMDDTNDEFEIEAEDNANVEGITVLLQEANQEFRIRGASRLLAFQFDPNDAVGPIQTINDIDTDSTLTLGWRVDDLPEISSGGVTQGLTVQYGDAVIKATVNYDDASPVAICTVADGWIVTDVWVEITTIWDGNGTIEIGDGVDPNGFLDDANINQGVAGLYGLDENARGAYLNNSIQKEYTGADTVDATLVVGTSTQGVAVVYVHMTRIK